MESGSGTRNPQRSRIWPWVLLSVVLMIVLVGAATLRFGLVHGQEFSPGLFQRRSFVWYEIPLVGIQFTPISRTNTTNDLEKYVVQQKWVAELTSGVRDWDLVEGGRGAERAKVEGGAAILCAYLDAKGPESGLFWLDWSEKSPQLAAILWPQVAILSREELYTYVPPLFRLAARELDPEQFSREAKTLMERAYSEQAELMERAGSPDLAKQLRQKAAGLSP